MEGNETANPSLDTRRPRTATVLVLLACISIIFSYLVAYAMANALVAAEVIPQWSPGQDPRLRWFGTTFASLMGSFMVIGALFRFASRRQLRKLEEMEDAPEDIT